MKPKVKPFRERLVFHENGSVTSIRSDYATDGGRIPVIAIYPNPLIAARAMSHQREGAEAEREIWARRLEGLENAYAAAYGFGRSVPDETWAPHAELFDEIAEAVSTGVRKPAKKTAKRQFTSDFLTTIPQLAKNKNSPAVCASLIWHVLPELRKMVKESDKMIRRLGEKELVARKRAREFILRQAKNKQYLRTYRVMLAHPERYGGSAIMRHYREKLINGWLAEIPNYREGEPAEAKERVELLYKTRASLIASKLAFERGNSTTARTHADAALANFMKYRASLFAPESVSKQKRP